MKTINLTDAQYALLMDMLREKACDLTDSIPIAEDDGDMDEAAEMQEELDGLTDLIEAVSI